jgi:hypothetical protein
MLSTLRQAPGLLRWEERQAPSNYCRDQSEDFLPFFGAYYQTTLFLFDLGRHPTLAAEARAGTHESAQHSPIWRS